MEFEEPYLDVLENIEFAILDVARSDGSVLDMDVMDALETVRRGYAAESSGRTPPGNRLGAQARAVSDAVREMCEFRLGRTAGGDARPLPPQVEPVSVEAILECLKRIEKSVRRWNKTGERRGYIDFVSQYVR